MSFDEKNPSLPFDCIASKLQQQNSTLVSNPTFVLPIPPPNKFHKQNEE